MLETRTVPLVLLALSSSAWADQSCHTECFPDKVPTCATWLRKDINSEVAGIYELNNGVVNMSCAFGAIPVPTTISWVHKVPNSNSWTEFACSTKEEKKLCKDSEHFVESNCILRTSDLNMSGSYRCQAFTKGDSASKDSKAFGSEFHVSIVGVSKLEVVESYLHYGKLGFIEIEICANPKPEIFWVTSDSIIKPDERTHAAAATHLRPKKHQTSPNGPATIVPYCYKARLLIRRVGANDTFLLAVRTDGSTQTTPLSLEVANVPVASAGQSLLFLLLASLGLRVF